MINAANFSWSQTDQSYAFLKQEFKENGQEKLLALIREINCPDNKNHTLIPHQGIYKVIDVLCSKEIEIDPTIQQKFFSSIRSLWEQKQGFSFSQLIGNFKTKTFYDHPTNYTLLELCYKAIRYNKSQVVRGIIEQLPTENVSEFINQVRYILILVKEFVGFPAYLKQPLLF